MKNDSETRVSSDSAFILPPSSLFPDGDSGGRTRRRRGGQMKRRLFNLLAAVSLM